MFLSFLFSSLLFVIDPLARGRLYVQFVFSSDYSILTCIFKFPALISYDRPLRHPQHTAVPPGPGPVSPFTCLGRGRHILAPAARGRSLDCFSSEAADNLVLSLPFSFVVLGGLFSFWIPLHLHNLPLSPLF